MSISGRGVILACGGGLTAGVDHRAVGNPGGIGAARQKLAKMHPAFTAHVFQALEFAERIGVIVDA